MGLSVFMCIIASKVLSVGQRLDRLIFGDPAERRKAYTDEEASREISLRNMLQRYIPKDAKDFKHLGGYWCSFSIEVAGSVRDILMYRNDSVTQIIELQPAPVQA